MEELSFFLLLVLIIKIMIAVAIILLIFVPLLASLVRGFGRIFKFAFRGFYR